MPPQAIRTAISWPDHERCETCGLTAAHCAPDEFETVDWADDTENYASNLNIANTLRNPHYGGSTDDWPWALECNNDCDGHHHDSEVVFVPEITPEWINKHLRIGKSDTSVMPTDGVVPMINPRTYGTPDKQVAIGDQSSREFAKSRYDESFDKRQLQHDIIGIDDGDSGGPTMTYEKTGLAWLSEPFAHRARVVGVHKSEVQESDVAMHHEGLDTSGSVMDYNSRQAAAARINQQWVRAAASDADGDTIPYLCDSDPSSGSSSSNNCPPLMGRMRANEPRGMLKCKPGYVATGYKGNAGELINELSIHCTPTHCLREPNADNCPEEYWTREYAGRGNHGDPFADGCSDGNAITYVRGQHTSDSELNEFQAWCYDYSDWVDNSSATNGESLATVGNNFGGLDKGASYNWKFCNGYEVFRGFQAGSKYENNDPTDDSGVLKAISGLHPICNPSETSESPYIGGNDGKMYRSRKCPEGMIGIGLVASIGQYDSNMLGALGMLCHEKEKVANDDHPNYFELLAAHGNYYAEDSNGNWSVYPYMTEDYYTWAGRDGLGSDFQVERCDDGERLVSIQFEATSTDLTQLDGYTCRDNSGNEIFKRVNIGSESTNYTLSCEDKSTQGASGFIMSGGWHTDGVSVLCDSKP